jgi:uncharacterized protein YecT (DUF1311 family)
MMLRSAVPLVLASLLAPTFATAAAAAEPSFDCRTAKTARELATCNDAKLAAADREIATTWHEAIARLDPVTAKALREDQRKFLSDIDDGFDAELWGKQDRPEGKELHAQSRSFAAAATTTSWPPSRRSCASAPPSCAI